MKLLALDHGNGAIKMKTKEFKAVYPSLIAYSEAGAGKKIKKYKIGGKTYYWGSEIVGAETYVTYAQQNRYDLEHYKILSIIALAEMISNSTQDAKNEYIVMTGVPSDEVDTNQEGKLKEAIQGFHEVKIFDAGTEKTIRFNVKEVYILAQPLGTLMSRYIDEDGSVKEERYEETKVAIVDIGTGTTDLDIVHNLMRLDNYHSIRYGTHDVYKPIVQKFNRMTKLEMDLHRLEKYFDQGYMPRSGRIQEVCFQEEKQKGITDTANKILDGTTKAWKTFDDFHEVLLTGGGARIFYKQLEKHIGNLTLVEESQMANVEGFYRYGLALTGEE